MENLDYNLALLAAALVCFIGVRVHRWWKAGGRLSSPTGGDPAKKGVTSQASTEMTPQLTPANAAAGEEAAAGGGRTQAIDRWVAAQPAATSTAVLVRRAHIQLGVSKSAVMRALRRLRNNGAAAGGGR